MYTLKELAIMSSLTERTLRSYLKMGILGGKKEDGIWRFDEADIEAFAYHFRGGLGVSFFQKQISSHL